jgi:hypothetical protein
MKKIATYVVYPLVVIGMTVGLFKAVHAAVGSNIDATDRYAWGTDVGWIDFAPPFGGVTVYSDHLEGYAWGEKLVGSVWALTPAAARIPTATVLPPTMA